MSQLKIYDLATASWKYVSSPSQMVAVSDSPPVAPINGGLWWDTDDASLLVDTIDPNVLAINAAFTSRYVAVPTTWTTPTFVTNWIAASHGFQYCRVGNHGILQGGVQWTGGTVATAGQIITTLPVGFRPAAIRRFVGWQNNIGVAIRCSIDTAGVVMIDDSLATSRSWELHFYFSTVA